MTVGRALVNVAMPSYVLVPQGARVKESLQGRTQVQEPRQHRETVPSNASRRQHLTTQFLWTRLTLGSLHVVISPVILYIFSPPTAGTGYSTFTIGTISTRHSSTQPLIQSISA
jgi:hypothetical protein